MVAWVRSRDVQSLGTGVGSLSGLCGGHRSSGWGGEAKHKPAPEYWEYQWLSAGMCRWLCHVPGWQASLWQSKAAPLLHPITGAGRRLASSIGFLKN